jgi:hypothetical protein
LLPLMNRHLPGVQSAAEFSLRPLVNPPIGIGYGEIDATEIGAAFRCLRRALGTRARG